MVKTVVSSGYQGSRKSSKLTVPGAYHLVNQAVSLDKEQAQHSNAAWKGNPKKTITNKCMTTSLAIFLCYVGLANCKSFGGRAHPFLPFSFHSTP
jgi:hypothetical protein